MDFVLDSLDLLLFIGSYCNGNDLIKLTFISKSFYKIFNDNLLWKQLCDIYGFKSLKPTTKTRGYQSYKTIYKSALCFNCSNYKYGSIILDIHGGCKNSTSSLISICIICYKDIQQYKTFSDRQKNCLLFIKDYTQKLLIFNKISYSKKKNNKRKYINEYDNPNCNDYLVQLLK